MRLFICSIAGDPIGIRFVQGVLWTAKAYALELIPLLGESRLHLVTLLIARPGCSAPERH